VKDLTVVRKDTICVSGGIPLPRLPFAVADAPMPVSLGDSFPPVSEIWTGAGTRPIWLQHILVWLAHGASKGIVPKLARFAVFSS